MTRVIPHLAALAALLLCLRLAVWQGERAEQKADILERWHDAPGMALSAVDPADIPRYATVRARGRLDPERHILLDNQIRDGRPGVHVFTPLYPDDSERIWLVNRGWQPRRPGAATLPEFDTPGEAVAISGRIDDPPRVGFELGRAQALDEERWPNLMTYFDLERIRAALGERVAGAVILLDPEHPAHLGGDAWQPVSFGPDRHRAYRLQWFSLALAVAVIWSGLTLRSMIRR